MNKAFICWSWHGQFAEQSGCPQPEYLGAELRWVARREEGGWITTGDGYALRGTLFEAIANGVASGEIRVKVEA